VRLRVAQSLAPVLIAGAIACGSELPLPERIASTRPLAVRVEAVDPTADPEEPVRAEVLPTERVRLVPFIVDPHGPLSVQTITDAIEPVWLACPLRPIEGLFGCLSARTPLAPDTIEACPESTLAGVEGLEDLPTTVAPCQLTGGSPGRPELDVPLDPTFIVGGDLEVTMVGHVPGRSSTSACLEHLLQGPDTFDEDCLFVTQRVPVGPEALLRQLALDLGLASPEQLGPLPETIPDPDAHPRIVLFFATVYDASGDEIGRFHIERGDVLELPAGARLEIETEAPEDDLQVYLVPRDGESFAERREVYRGRWYRTWGTLVSSTSNDPVSFNTWTLEEGPQDDAEPPEGRATLYYVLRDDRQGVDWWWFHVNVTGQS
jgi:hypothetical protein